MPHLTQLDRGLNERFAFAMSFSDLPMAKDSVAAPAGATAGKSPVAEGAGVGDLDADLQSRLDNLRRE